MAQVNAKHDSYGWILECILWYAEDMFYIEMEWIKQVKRKYRTESCDETGENEKARERENEKPGYIIRFTIHHFYPT